VRPPSEWPNLIAGRRRANDLESSPATDSRRRLGGHSRARQFLVSGHSAAVTAEGRWRGLVSALQRHAIENALVEMSPEDKEVLTLAYLQGQTNSEIAARLSVSARTVRRRLSIALARLEERARRSGAWISSITTAAFLHIAEQGARVGRAVGDMRPGDWSTGLTAALTAGALTAVGLSLLVADHRASSVDLSRAPAAAPYAGLPYAIGPTVKSPLADSPLEPARTRLPAGQPAALASRESSGANLASPNHSRDTVEGCQSNPTSAPPIVPVGPPQGHPSGAPVTHPSAGGCDRD